jgi:hypothetical protein
LKSTAPYLQLFDLVRHDLVLALHLADLVLRLDVLLAKQIAFGADLLVERLLGLQTDSLLQRKYQQEAEGDGSMQ